MMTGEIRSKIDAVWNAFWAGGIANPLEVIEQITYLLFLRRLDDEQAREENLAARRKEPLARRIFPKGKDDIGKEGRPYEDFRWSRFKHFAPAEMYSVMSEHIFPFLRGLGGESSTYAKHMKDARFTVPTPALLSKVVDLLDQVPMEDRDTKGDLYEYMLGKIASAGQNGQFRTPRHIIRLMVELTAPTATDIICDPACGTAGFLVAAGEYVRGLQPNPLLDKKLRAHFHKGMFHGFDFDNTMLRIGSMNMLLHGVDNPDIRYRDSLAQDHAGDEDAYTLVLANPPFAGSLDHENTAKELQAVVKTRKTELLFLALFLRLLKPGGRAAVIVPDGVLFGSSNAHKQLRRMLVEEQKLDGVVSLPGGVFKPYAGVPTAILLFTKTNSGGTDRVWFYDVAADGWSLDDKRTPLLHDDKLGPTPKTALAKPEHDKNNLPDVLARWSQRNSSERKRPRTAQSFCVPKSDIAAQGYDLSLNRYKEVVHEEVQHRSPKEILAELAKIETEIEKGMKELGGDGGMNSLAAIAPWPEVPLDSLLIFLTSGSRGWAQYYADSGSLFLRIQNVGRNRMILDDVAYVNAPDTAEANRTRVQAGDVLLSITADLGRTAVVPDQVGGAFINQHLAILRTKNVQPEYLSAFLSSPSGQSQIAGRNRHGVKAGLNFDDIRSFRIPLPPLSEQRRIAEVLDRAEALRAKRRAALAHLDTLTQSIFQTLFGDPTRHESTIADLLSSNALLLHKDGNHGSLYPRADDFGVTGVPFLSAKSVTDDGQIDNALIEHLREDKAGRLRIGWILNGDVLLAHNASVGKVALYDGRFARALIGTSLTAFRPNPEILDSRYFAAALRSAAFQRQLVKNMGQTTRNQVPITAQRGLRVHLPPIGLQREFAVAIAAVEKLKSAHRASLAKLEELFACLQHRAFRGEL